MCDICAGFDRSQMLPDRFDNEAPYKYHMLCPLCLDLFLGIYPKLFMKLRQREIHGKHILYDKSL